MLGEGAYGIVRKCLHKIPDAKDTTSTNSDTNSNGSKDVSAPSSYFKMTTILPKIEDTKSKEASSKKEMAVKLQSKYQMIKSKQEQHLFNEISLMNKMNHPFILKLNGVS